MRSPDHAILLSASVDPRRYWADHYAGMGRAPSEALRRAYALSAVHRRAVRWLPEVGRIVDAGCGLGVIGLLNDKPGCAIVGVDPSTALLRTARVHAPRSRFVAGTLEALPLEDAAYDGYVAISALEWTKTPPRRTLEEAYRVLRPGGRLFVACLRLPRVLRGRTEAWHTCALGRVEIRRGASDDPRAIGTYYAERTLRRAAHAAGFGRIRVTQCDVMGGLSYEPALGPWAARVRQAVQAFSAARVQAAPASARTGVRAAWMAESGPAFARVAPLWGAIARLVSAWNVLEAVRVR